MPSVDRLRQLQAARLKEARELRGFKTASDAARRFGWSVPTWVSHENGTRGIGRMYREYAKTLRVNAAWMLGHSVERDLVDLDDATRLSTLEMRLDDLERKVDARFAEVNEKLDELLQRLKP